MPTSQTSKKALKRLDKAEYLVMSIKTHMSRVTDALTGIFRQSSPAGAGESATPPDWNQIQTFHVDILETATEDVRQTDQAHRHNKVKAKGLRTRRGELIGKLKQWYKGLRKSFEGTYGSDSWPLVGLDAPPERAQLAAREQVLEVVERMKDPTLASRLPEPLPGQVPLDLETLSESMSTEIQELEDVLEAIKQMRKHQDASYIAKEKAVKEHRRVYSNVARVQEGYYRLVGFDDLADRIRLTERSPRRKEEEKEESEETDSTSQETTPQASA